MYSCKEPQNYVKLGLKKTKNIAKKMQTNQNDVIKY